jgi:hypothetical protein
MQPSADDLHFLGQQLDAKPLRLSASGWAERVAPLPLAPKRRGKTVLTMADPESSTQALRVVGFS